MAEFITEWSGTEPSALHREHIIRCRDCRLFKPGEEEPPIDWCDYFHDEVTPLGFCAWGEKVSE